MLSLYSQAILQKDLLGVVRRWNPACIIIVCHSFEALTLVAAVKNARESVGAFDVEKGGNREDQEQADQQSSKK